MSRALVRLLQQARKKHIYDNDQHSEGLIKSIKKQPDRKINCDEAAQYFQARYKDLKQCNRAFVANLQKMNDVVDRRRENAAADINAERGGNDATEDAVNNDAAMVKDAPWGTGRRGPEAEKQLRRKLEERFTEAFDGRNYTQWHAALSNHIVDSGVGTIQGMQYRRFSDWMNGKKTGTKGTSAGALRGMEHFVNHWKGP